MAKRRLLVLDAFTNGHDATLAFMQSHRWSVADTDIVFCRTHANVFAELAKGPAFAVVPVRNSIAGEVVEVTSELDQYRGRGYEFVQRAQLALQINHCLLAQPSVKDPHELTRVLSHEKAFQQCGRFLDSLGIPADARALHSSTGNAARTLALMQPHAHVGAIASRAAAEEYGLQVLAENIQDVNPNLTTFWLIENESRVESCTVGIIGINGQFGRTLAGFFTGLDCVVIGSDPTLSAETLTNEEVVERADVVIFAVPIHGARGIIRSLAPLSREDQLWMDVTSLKAPAIEAMLESRAEVVGLHPMFRPEVSFEGQTVVACPARLTQQRWKTWVVNMLAATHATVKWSTAEEHDRYMLVVQVAPHLANLATALLITEMGVSVGESIAYTSPFYRILFSLMGRLVSQNPEMYASILVENEGSVRMLEQRIEIEQRLVAHLRAQDERALVREFVLAREHFGDMVTDEANTLFMRLLSVLSTLYGSNSVVLEFRFASDQPGLLERVAGVFHKHQINLTGFNTVRLPDERLQFAIALEQSRRSDAVRRALEEMQGWDIGVQIM